MTTSTDAQGAIEAEARYGAHNYDPLPVVLCQGEGVWVRDLHSRNGTFVDDERLPPGQGFLVDTDARIRFGPYCAVMFKLKQS